MTRVAQKPPDWLKPAAVSFSGVLDGGLFCESLYGLLLVRRTDPQWQSNWEIEPYVIKGDLEHARIESRKEG